MNQEQLIERFRAECDRLVSIVRDKNDGYAGNSLDALHNFQLVEFLTDGKISSEVGIVVRMIDKLKRAYSLMDGVPDAVGEPLADTLRDLAAYSLLALIAHDAKQKFVCTVCLVREPLGDLSRCEQCIREGAKDSLQNMAACNEALNGTQGPQLDHSLQTQQPLNEKQQGAWASLVETMRKWS